jgi:hypothetical protein
MCQKAKQRIRTGIIDLIESDNSDKSEVLYLGIEVRKAVEELNQHKDELTERDMDEIGLDIARSLKEFIIGTPEESEDGTID